MAINTVGLENAVFSEGTLNLEHLLAKAYDFLKKRGYEGDLLGDILDCYEFDQEFSEKDSLFTAQYYSWAKLKDEEKASWVWEKVCDFFDSIAPEGYYFGTLEGDGACFGWFAVSDI